MQQNKTLQFKYNMSDNYLVFEHNIDTCWLIEHYIDVEHIKIFILLLKEAIQELKKLNIKKFIQYVSGEDWTNFLENNNLWTMESEIEDIKKISCNIDDTVISMSKGFGIIE
jgi:hypothetical protein